MKKLNWKYLATGRSKNVMHPSAVLSARCGMSPLWYLSDAERQWKNDDEGLNKRPACKRCLILTNLDKEKEVVENSGR
jgi:hypothetical protein